MLRQMKVAGFPQAELDKAEMELRLKASPDTFPVHPENAVAVRLMLMGQTQWRQVGLSGLSRALLVKTGLDYAGVEAIARLEGLETTPLDWRLLRDIEGEALSAWAEEAR